MDKAVSKIGSILTLNIGVLREWWGFLGNEKTGCGHTLQLWGIGVIIHGTRNYCKFGLNSNTTGTIELKADLLRILNKIEDEQLVRVVYDFLKQDDNAEVGQIWKTLTEAQKREVYASYEESRDDNNLSGWGDVKKKY